jgi:hypothetical protein
LSDIKKGEPNKKKFVKYENKAFEIQQMSAFNLQKKGNEIKTTINDLSSMVKSVEEWLFNFDMFTSDMAKMGFEVLRKDFIDGPDVQFLSKEAYLYSSLNRIFCFYRTPELKKQRFIPPREVNEVVAYPNEYEKDMIIKGVPIVNGFVHSILEATDEEYQRLAVSVESSSREKDKSVKERNKYVRKFLKGLAEDITFKEFKGLHGGELIKRMAYQITRDTGNNKEVAEAMAFKKYTERIKDSGNVSDNSLLEILADKFDLSIYIVTINDKGLSMYFYYPLEVYCDRVLNHENCIVIVKSAELEYGYVGNETSNYYIAGRKLEKSNQFLFEDNDPFIKKLKMDSCL